MVSTLTCVRIFMLFAVATVVANASSLHALKSGVHERTWARFGACGTIDGEKRDSSPCKGLVQDACEKQASCCFEASSSSCLLVVKPTQLVQNGQKSQTQLVQKPKVVSSTPNLLPALLTTLANYKVVNNDQHHGHLLAHSAWTALAIEKWFREQSPFVSGLESRKAVTFLAGFLHDIGKGKTASRSLKIVGGSPTHPAQGQEMLEPKPETATKWAEFTQLNEKGEATGVFDFKAFIQSVGLDPEEDRHIIGVTTGMHYQVGIQIMKPWHELDSSKKAKPLKAWADKWWQDLQRIKAVSGFSFTIPDLLLARMCVVVSLADVMGSKPISSIAPTYESTIIPGIFNQPADTALARAGKDAWTLFGYEQVAPAVMELILSNAPEWATR